MRLEAIVEGLFLGDQTGLEKSPVNRLFVDLGGILGDKHYGPTRLADSRTPKITRGTPIRNTRQWSAVSPEQCAEIASGMGVTKIEPGWLGANLSLAEISNLTELPQGTELIFPQNAVLLVEGENLPCRNPGEVIALKYPEKGLNPGLFPKAARGKRGLIGTVKVSGYISLNDKVVIEVYEPTTYSFPSNLGVK